MSPNPLLLLQSPSSNVPEGCTRPGWFRVGDGDCGTTLAQGSKAIQADCSRKYPLNDAAACMSAVAESVGHSMGGSSGALYQIFFVALAGQQLSVASASCCLGLCGGLDNMFAEWGNLLLTLVPSTPLAACLFGRSGFCRGLGSVHATRREVDEQKPCQILRLCVTHCQHALWIAETLHSLHEAMEVQIPVFHSTD